MIPFLVGSTVAFILVLAVVVGIVIARSGGGDVAEPQWRATSMPAGSEFPPLLERDEVIRAYASCRGRYRGDERLARAETVTSNLDQGRRTMAQLKVIISIECPPAWAVRMGISNEASWAARGIWLA